MSSIPSSSARSPRRPLSSLLRPQTSPLPLSAVSISLFRVTCSTFCSTPHVCDAVPEIIRLYLFPASPSPFGALAASSTLPFWAFSRPPCPIHHLPSFSPSSHLPIVLLPAPARQRQTEKDRGRQRRAETDRQTNKERQRQAETDRDRHRQTTTDSHKQPQTESERQRQPGADGDKQNLREGDEQRQQKQRNVPGGATTQIATSQPTGRSAGRPANLKKTTEPSNQNASQPANQSASQFARQPTDQPAR